MTTFSSQRKDPGVAKAEERLCEILTCLGLDNVPIAKTICIQDILVFPCV